MTWKLQKILVPLVNCLSQILTKITLRKCRRTCSLSNSILSKPNHMLRINSSKSKIVIILMREQQLKDTLIKNNIPQIHKLLITNRQTKIHLGLKIKISIQDSKPYNPSLIANSKSPNKIWKFNSNYKIHSNN